MNPLDRLRRIAEVEFAAIVVQTDVLGSKLRVLLTDTGYVDMWASRKLSGRLGFHWERRHLFSDEALWAATRPSLSPAKQFRLNQLNHKAGERPLTQAEEAEQEHLLTAYHRSVLHRAKALAILAQRGHPLPVETELPDDAQ